MYYEPIYDIPRPYSFELNPDMMDILEKEFDVNELVTRFAAAIDSKKREEIGEIGRQLFGKYGTDLIKRTLQLGEEYPDRTYEVLKIANEHCGGVYTFALIPERFLEIAYLSTHKLFTLPIIENNKDRLIYRLTDCLTYKTLIDKCGEEVANLLPCKHFCLTACEVLHQDLDIDARIRMTASMVDNGYCEFTVTPA